jgi:hypothetical protein
LRPLFDLIQSWLPELQANARKFIGIDDGLMLPHAVDDRCKIIGNFWTGTIDHACTAWVGKMMYDYWSFGGGDEQWARQVMFPFLRGAMRVFEEMLQREPDGSLSLPVSVSPEYRGAAMNAWGRNASFQIGCIHMLCEKLVELADRFGQPRRAIWEQVLAGGLPVACVAGAVGREHIHLWEGTPLEESHRHHSHLAGITPFDVIDPTDPNWDGIVKNSISHWIYKGPGMWSGWCVPWASQIHTRVGNAGMAELLLEIWQKVFTNAGHGTLHDCEINGFTLLGAAPPPPPGTRKEIMQMDAGMGVVEAITDMLLHRRRGTHYFFAGSPATWDAVSFRNLHTAGGFRVSASRIGGQFEATLHATRDGIFRYLDPRDQQIKHLTLTAGQTRSL